MVVLGELDMYELDGSFFPKSAIRGDSIDGAAIETSQPDQKPFYLTVRVMMIFLSFVMGLSMMNLFIAMLCVSYNRASACAEIAWTRSRARVAFDHQAIRHGFYI